MGRPGHDLRRWNSLGAPLVPVAEDDRELKISPAVSPMRGPRVGSGPDACASLTCDEGSLSESSDIVAPQVLPVTSAALRLGLLAVPEPRVPAIGAGSVNRLPGTSGTPSQRRAFDGRRAQKKPAGLGCRSYSLGSGLSMLRARRPPRSAAAKDSEYHPLMPLVLQALGRLRCVRCHAPIGVAFSFPVLPRFRARGTVFSCGVCASAVFAVETRKKTVSVSVARFSVSTTDDFSFRFVSATHKHTKKKKNSQLRRVVVRPRPRAGRVVPRALARGRGERPAPRVELGPRRDRASVRRVAGHAPQALRARVGGRVRRRNRKRALRGFARGLVHRGGAHAHRRVAFFRVRRGGRDPLVRARDGAHERGRPRGPRGCACERLFRRAGARVRRGVRAVALVRGQQAVRRRGAHAFSVFFRRFRSCQRSWFFGCGHFFQSRFGCGHFFLATSARATTPATRFDSRTAS